MATQKLWIEGKLPGLNEIVGVAKQHWGNYAKMKQEWTEIVAMSAKAQVIQPVDRAFFVFHWVEPDRLRDLDNIAAAKKFILDGFVEIGILHNDGWKHVVGWIDRFEVNKDNPGVEVIIHEADNGDELVAGYISDPDNWNYSVGPFNRPLQSRERPKLGEKSRSGKGSKLSWPFNSDPQWDRIRILS